MANRSSSSKRIGCCASRVDVVLQRATKVPGTMGQRTVRPLAEMLLTGEGSGR